MKVFVVFKWELKKAVHNPLHVIVFLIIPLLLLLLSAGNKEVNKKRAFPIVVGISAPADLPIVTMQSDTLILIRSVPDTLSISEKKDFFFNLIRRELVTGAVIISPGYEQWVIAGSESEAEMIRDWVSKSIRKNITDKMSLSGKDVYFLVEGIDQASSILLTERDGMAAFWLIAVFVFGVALTGSVFAKSMYEERKGKLLEVFLTTCSPDALVWGKFTALFVFSLLQFALLYAGVLLFTETGTTVGSTPLAAGAILGISSLFFITAWYFFTGISVITEIGFVGLSFLTLTLLAIPVWLPSGNGLFISEFFRWIPFTMFQSSLPGVLMSNTITDTAFQILIQFGCGILLLHHAARLLGNRIDR